jgi:hypothetical protein
MAPYRNSPPPDWAGWGDGSLYSPRSDPLSGGYDPGEDYAELTAPELSAPPRSTTPFGQFLPSLLDAVARRPQPAPFGQFLRSIGVHLPPPQSVLAMRRYDPPPPTLMVQPVPAQDVILDDALLEPWPATGPALPGEDITGFGTTVPRVPAEFERTRGDGVWRNAAAGAGEHVYGHVGTYVDPAIEVLNGGISGLNALAGTDIGRLPPASRWVAENAEEYLGVPDPEHTQAITPGEKAARLSGNAAAYLVELLLTRGRGLPSFPPGPNGPRPPGPLSPGPTGPRLPGPPLPGPTSPRPPALPGTVFDDVRDVGKLGLDLIGELRDAFSARAQPSRSLNEAGDWLTGGVVRPDGDVPRMMLEGARVAEASTTLSGGALGAEARERRRQQLAINKAVGKAYERTALADITPKSAVLVQTEVMVRSNGPSGGITRLDAVGIDPATGEIVLYEFKSSRTAPLTPRQKEIFQELEAHGGVFVSHNKPPYDRGIEFPSMAVQIKRDTTR